MSDREKLAARLEAGECSERCLCDEAAAALRAAEARAPFTLQTPMTDFSKQRAEEALQRQEGIKPIVDALAADLVAAGEAEYAAQAAALLPEPYWLPFKVTGGCIRDAKDNYVAELSSPFGGDIRDKMASWLVAIANGAVLRAPAQEPVARAPKVRTNHHRNKEEAARLQELVDERYAATQPHHGGMGWQPIEAWNPQNVSAHWPYLQALVVSDGVVMGADWKPGGDPPTTGEWWPANLDSEYGSQIFPTHWQPLPAPPASPDHRESGEKHKQAK